MPEQNPVTRRSFLKTGSAALAAAGMLAAWPRRPGTTAQAARRTLGANDRIVFGFIGVGSMGGGHVSQLLKMRESHNLALAAVCDVYRRRANAQAQRCGGQAYADYRKLLEDQAIDAVVVATPDHWHFKNAMDAIEAGKHVYLQKPMTHTVEEAIRLRQKIRGTKDIVLQVGVQSTGDVRCHHANEMIRAGQIGHVLWSQSSYCRNNPRGEWNYTIDKPAGPQAGGDDYIDWDMWLGHEFGLAPRVDWNPEHFFRFRKYWAYSGGIAAVLFYHRLAKLLRTIEGPQGACPLRVSSGGGVYIQKDGRDVPDTLAATIDYPGEHTIVLTSSMANNDQPPDRIYGQYGTIDLESGATAQKPFLKEFQAKSGGAGQVPLPKPGPGQQGNHDDHLANFIDVIRGKQKELYCGVELGTAAQIAITMSVLAYRQKQTLTWDNYNDKVQPAG